MRRAILGSLGLLCLAAGLRAKPDHIVLVIEENRGFTQIIGSAECPYMNELAAGGAILTQSYAIRHPSQPNYLALFSGNVHGVEDDQCPPIGSPYKDENLGSLLKAAGYSFVGYSEDIPEPGYLECKDIKKSGYRRKHNPWSDFTNLPLDASQPFSKFPSDFSQLPTVAFVIPNLNHDMHDGTPLKADQWLHKKLGAYADWCVHNNSVLIVTWDEDNGAEDNRLPTFAFGSGIHQGKVDFKTDHYGMLRTLCGLYGLKAPGHAAEAQPIEGLFE